MAATVDDTKLVVLGFFGAYPAHCGGARSAGALRGVIRIAIGSDGGRTTTTATARRTTAGGGEAPVRRVGKVEGLSAELQFEALPHREGLVQAQVKVARARTLNTGIGCIAPRSS